jgi:hypothetical protein
VALSFYVYYRIAPGQRALARERSAILLERVARTTGVHGRLLVRRGEPDLWMEVYEPVDAADPFAVALDHAVRELAFDSVLAPGATRKLECFERACA